MICDENLVLTCYFFQINSALENKKAMNKNEFEKNNK